LYLVSLLLVVTLGAWVQSVHLSWGLIATEALLIALPAVLFLRARGIPLREGLGLRRISLATAVLCLLLGAAMYLVGILIEGVMAQLSGLPSVPLDDNLLPKTSAEMALYFTALAISAPLGEEILFRGALQGAYQSRKSARFAITLTALLFAFYHLRLTGLPALLPVAFVLSFVMFRTRSLYAGMLVHFANNAFAAAQTISFLSTGKGLPFLSLWSALAGLVVAAAALVLLARMHPKPAAEPQVEAASPAETRPRKSWLAVYWPLLAAGVVYLVFAGMTLAQALIPGLVPVTDDSYGSSFITAPVENRYEIRNRGGEVVGEMTCTLSPNGMYTHLACDSATRAYEVRVDNSTYIDGGHSDTLQVKWESNGMQLVQFELQRTHADGATMRSYTEGGRLVTEFTGETQSVEIPQYALLEMEWFWRATVLKANTGQALKLPYVSLLAWDPEQQQAIPSVTDEVLRVAADETLPLGGTEVAVRKLVLGDRTLWVARDDATAGITRPAQMDDGMVTYTLLP
jgi:membrane protease YdiL (CAAX protease family)